jgi:hypothetical protein
MKNIINNSKNDLPFCECGCEERVTKLNNKYIHNHHTKGIPSPNRGKKRPEHSKRMMGSNNPMYGRKRDDMVGVLNLAKRDDIRLKIKENNPMKKLENRQKLSLSKRGKKRLPFSDEWRRNLGNFYRGKKRPNHSQLMKGELNPNWKGGITCEPYCQVWADNEYKESIKERDGYKCLNPECNRTSIKICIHHIDYNKKNCHPRNLVTICFGCNGKANGNREWHQSWYQAIIFRRYKEI